MKVCKTVSIYEYSAIKLIQNQINKESAGLVAAHIPAVLVLKPRHAHCALHTLS